LRRRFFAGSGPLAGPSVLRIHSGCIFPDLCNSLFRLLIGGICSTSSLSGFCMLLFLCVQIPAGARIRESFPPVRGSRFVRTHGFVEIISLHRCTFSSDVPRICIFCTSGVFFFFVLVAGEIVSFWGFFV